MSDKGDRQGHVARPTAHEPVGSSARTRNAEPKISHDDDKTELMRDLLSRLPYASRGKKLVAPDRNIVFEFTPDCLATHRLAR